MQEVLFFHGVIRRTDRTAVSLILMNPFVAFVIVNHDG